MTVETALQALSSLLGDGLVLSKPDLVQHGRSESYFDTVAPDAVVYPASTDEVSAILKICSDHGCPVIPFGAGTALEGHTTPVRGGVTVDMSRMNRILSINTEDMDCTVEAGVTRRQLQTELRTTGLMFPVDPGADATLGGMAATRASGTTTVRYGTMRQNVMGLTVVLADGRVIRTGSRARKSSAGYDLTAMFLGSEGTLGLITEITLRLHGVPEGVSAALCAFDTVEDAVACVIATSQMGIPMARIELIDAISVTAFNAYANMDMPETPHLMVEFHGSPESAAEDARRFGELAGEMGATGFDWAETAEDRNRLWRMRHDGYYAIKAAFPGRSSVVTDICVPISKLAEAIEETRADIAEAGLPGPIVGHVGDGNFHATLMVREGDAGDLATAKALAHRMAERALALGGTVSGEHGVGLGKMKYMASEHGDAWAVMASLKRALDPGNIMNPGKVVDVN